MGKNGLNLVKKIRLIDKKAQCILVTKNISQVYLAFENKANLLDCINLNQTSDIIQRRLTDAILQAVKEQDLQSKLIEQSFTYRSKSRVYIENLDNIICITTTTRPHHLCLETLRGECEIVGSLQKLSKKYPKLRRISQSCLANENNIYLIDLERHEIIFINGRSEYYSKRARKVIKEILQHQEISK